MFLVPFTCKTPKRRGSLRSAQLIPGGLWRSPAVEFLHVLTGQAWITEAGDVRDHLLGPGQRWQPTGTGLVVVQALGSEPVSLEFRPRTSL